MSANSLELGIVTAEYSGADRRRGNERRVGIDRRRVIRFDVNGGDRRSGFCRRQTDEGLNGLDFY